MHAVKNGRTTVQKVDLVNEVSMYQESLVATVNGRRVEIPIRHLERFAGEVVDIDIDHSGKTVAEALDELPLRAVVYIGNTVYTKETQCSFSRTIWKWVKDTGDKKENVSGYW